MDNSVRIGSPSPATAGAVSTLASKSLRLLCCYCREELEEFQMFEFRGWVACERCVRDYYRDRPAEIEVELQNRQRRALDWLGRNRRALEKQAAREAKVAQ
jgi:hypothetical protein